jgi:NADH:ubiquinone oxidoreductase subunit F (NADH-binding)
VGGKRKRWMISFKAEKKCVTRLIHHARMSYLIGCDCIYHLVESCHECKPCEEGGEHGARDDHRRLDC